MDNILDEAKQLTTHDRQDVYGHPYEDFTLIGKIWGAILGKEITPEQVGLCMIAVKMGRLCHTPGHRDSIIDIAGYANTLDMIRQRRTPPAESDDIKQMRKIFGGTMFDTKP